MKRQSRGLVLCLRAFTEFRLMIQRPFNHWSGNPDIIAVLVEPIQGEGGINIPSSDYLQRLREICDTNNWLLMLDEIQTGAGRTGHWFACTGADVQPDVITSAKGLGNGLPIGACLARGNAASVLIPGSHGTTFGGNPLCCANSPCRS